MPFFSIVMPTLNRASLLAPTIASIEAQRFTDYEILLIDGGSTDGTLELAPTLSPKLRVIQQPPERKGIAAQRSTGFLEAKGEYIACLDSDDLMFPWTLETYKIAIDQQKPAFILANGLMFRKLEKLAEATEGDRKFTPYRNYLRYIRKPRVGLSVCSGCVIRTDYARSVVGLSDKIVYAEDSDMFLRLGEAPTFVRIEQPLMFGYRQHESNVSVNFDRMLKGMDQLIEEEANGRYPGGKKYELNRRSELTTLFRSAARRCIHKGKLTEGWSLYRRTIAWNMQCHKWPFLATYPFKMALAKLKGKKNATGPAGNPVKA